MLPPFGESLLRHGDATEEREERAKPPTRRGGMPNTTKLLQLTNISPSSEAILFSYFCMGIARSLAHERRSAFPVGLWRFGK
jgi:hypothetical protein